jgi:hypothetical protein
LGTITLVLQIRISVTSASPSCLRWKKKEEFEQVTQLWAP